MSWTKARFSETEDSSLKPSRQIHQTNEGSERCQAEVSLAALVSLSFSRVLPSHSCQGSTCFWLMERLAWEVVDLYKSPREPPLSNMSCNIPKHFYFSINRTLHFYNAVLAQLFFWNITLQTNPPSRQPRCASQSSPCSSAPSSVMSSQVSRFQSNFVLQGRLDIQKILTNEPLGRTRCHS